MKTNVYRWPTDTPQSADGWLEHHYPWAVAVGEESPVALFGTHFDALKYALTVEANR